VVPLMVAKRLKNKDIWCCPLEQGPEDLKIYCLTKDGRNNLLVSRFLRLVHQEVTSVKGVRSFLWDLA